MSFTAEQVVAALTIIFGSNGVVYFAVKRFTEERAKTKAAEVAREAEVNKALADAWARLVDSAEKREGAANDRIDRAITSIAGLTSALTDLTTTNKLVLEEIKRANTFNDAQSRPRST